MTRAGERLASASGSLLERRTSRRGFLARGTVAAAALAVAPLRYLLRPVSAWAVVAPGGCPSGSLCEDGFTEFCCQITGGENSCPPYSYMGGWWKCSHYSGGRLCGDEGVRYYVDCNLKPGQGVPGGCHCAHGSCGERRVGCNVFRYGQCNTQIGGTTPIVCRVVTCVNPSTIPGFNCNPTVMYDNSTCGHEAGCLSEGEVQIIGRNPGV